jgi:hypothetical protein
MGIRKIRRCKSCGRRFTPRNQKPTPYEGAEAPQTETAESTEPETEDIVRAAGSEAEKPDRVEPIEAETPTSGTPEEESDEHPRFGL